RGSLGLVLDAAAAGRVEAAGALVEVLAVGRQELAEVAVPLGRGWHRAEAGAAVDLLALDFDASEEEQLVAVLGVAVAEEDRAADVATRILERALRLLDAGNRVRPVVGRELVASRVVVQG